MAVRMRLRHQDDVRKKIQTDHLLKRLSDHVFENLELSKTQVRAIEILLKKTLPDLSAIEHSGDSENPIEHKATVEFVNADPTTKGT